MKKSARQLDHEIANALSRKSRARTSTPVRRTPAQKTPLRSVHATKAKGDTTGDKISIAALATMFDLPDWDRIDDMNQQHYWEMSNGAGDEDAQMEAERKAQEEVYNQWYDAVEHAASKLFEKHGLELKGTGKGASDKRPYEMKLVPSKSWNDVAEKIRETINGVGSFEFANLREFLNSGPYSAKQAVLSHLGWVKRYPDVYGDTSARSMYERHWR